jgi:Domain of unknown function (DUF6456)
MTAQSPATDFQKDSSAVLRKLKSNNAIIHRENSQWVVYSAQIPLGFLDAKLVNAMLKAKLLFRQAGDILVAKLNEQSPSYHDGETPLVRLFMRKDAKGQTAINAMQFAAGEKLRIDYERAHLERRITSSWDAPGGSRSGANQIADVSDGAIAARQRLHNACVAVGPELTGILYQVCCLTAGLEQAERALEVPSRSGKAILGLALTRLARHYGLIQNPNPIAKTSIGHWAREGYRPVIGA